VKTILPWRVFDALITAAVGVVAVVWLIYDAINLARTAGADGRDPLIRDRRFGYVIGMIIAVVGLAGVVKHYW
jgi:hypothetical protein